jgi:hypothetical protein
MLVWCHRTVECFFHNICHQPVYDDDTDGVAFPILSLLFHLPHITVCVPSELYCLFASVFLEILFCSHIIIIRVKIVIFQVVTQCSTMVCGWLPLLPGLRGEGSRFLQNVGNHLPYKWCQRIEVTPH